MGAELIKKTILIATCLILIGLTAISQPVKPQHSKKQHTKASKAEFILFMGGAYYIGDLNHEHFNLMQPGGGIGFRYNFDTRLAIRTNILMASIKGDDAESLDPALLQRNLSFKSSLLEISEQGEFNFMKYWMGEFKFLFTHYVFAGIAMYRFRPKALINDSWIELQPIGTEGQGTPEKPGFKKYKLTQVSIPFGLGLKINVAEKIGLSLEWGIRKTFTDYLDDVSTTYADPATLAPGVASLADRGIYSGTTVDNIGRQRGNSKDKDWYSFTGLVLSFAFTKPPPRCYAY